MKSANSKLFRTIATFRRSSIATQRQFAKQSRSLCSDMGMQHYNFFILNNSFNRAYIHLLLHIRPTTPRVNACRSILVQARTDASFVRETGDGRVMRIPAYFATPAVTVNEGQKYDIDTCKPICCTAWTSGTSAARISI